MRSALSGHPVCKSPQIFHKLPSKLDRSPLQWENIERKAPKSSEIKC
jgi:hypothetical protein